MNKKDNTLKVIGFACMIVGFGVEMISKQLEEKKLEKLVEAEIHKQLKHKQ